MVVASSSSIELVCPIELFFSIDFRLIMLPAIAIGGKTANIFLFEVGRYGRRGPHRCRREAAE